MGGSGDGVLWNARLWCEEARHEVVVALSITPSRDDHTARLDLTQGVEIGSQPTHGRFVVDFDEVIEAAATHESRLGAERLDETGGRRCGHWRRGGKVELDPGRAPIGCQETALGVEARLRIRFEMSVFP